HGKGGLSYSEGDVAEAYGRARGNPLPGQRGEQGADLVIDVGLVGDRRGDPRADRLAIATAQAVDGDLDRSLGRAHPCGSLRVAGPARVAGQGWLEGLE